MGREAQTKTIDGQEWQVTPWPGRHGIRIQARLAKLIAPLLGEDGGNERAVSALLAGLHEDDVLRLVENMLHGVRVEGQDASMASFLDRFASANYGALYKGLAFVLEVNFGDFLSLLGNIGDLTKGIPKAAEYREG